jgi:hypothetical protein
MDILQKLKLLLGKVEDIEEELYSLIDDIETELEDLEDEDEDEDEVSIGLTD